MANARTFIVQPIKQPEPPVRPRLMRAARISHVQARVVAETEIREATADELLELGGQGVKIEEVGAPE